jgi:uncharacterized membrane protein YozB (DUF420 family)
VELDPKVVYWTAALANMLAAIACACLGVRRVRGGDVAGHARLMKSAGALVGLFLVSYAVKVLALGREQLELWEPRYVHVLRFHELCIALMVLAGGTAFAIATRRRLIDPVARAAAARGTILRTHRRAGWTAIASSLLGAAGAAYVLYGMYARLP